MTTKLESDAVGCHTSSKGVAIEADEASANSTNLRYYPSKDILFTQRGDEFTIANNSVFQRLIRHSKDRYNKVSNYSLKCIFAESARMVVEKQGGRFLFRQQGGKIWQEFDNDKILFEIHKGLQKEK